MRGALCASVACLAAASFYFTEFLAAPSSQHVYGVYYGLRESGTTFAGYALFWLLVSGWMRRFSSRLVLATGMAVSLLVLNVAFAWTSGVLGYVLGAVPTWLPQGVIVDYLALIQFPAVRSTLDFYYLGWLGVLFLLSMAFFKSGIAKRIVTPLNSSQSPCSPSYRSLSFDRREFTFMSCHREVFAAGPVGFEPTADAHLIDINQRILSKMTG